jgi:hypothetical protein
MKTKIDGRRASQHWQPLPEVILSAWRERGQGGEPGQLPRPEGRSLFTTPAQRPEFWEQAGLTRESGVQPATFATGR